MLHIVKQFIFGLTLSVKFNNSLESFSGGQEAVNKNKVNELTKDQIEEIITDVNNDDNKDTLSYSDDIF